VTRKPGNTYSPAYVVKNVIDILVKHVPELREEQYDAQHRGPSYREIIDLCLERKFQTVESFLHGTKFKMREYVRDVGDDDVLEALHLSILNDSERVLWFILRSLRFNIGAKKASSDAQGILWVVCNAVYKRYENSEKTTWTVQDRERVRYLTGIFEYCFELFYKHQRRNRRDSSSYQHQDDPACRAFTGIDASGLYDPVIFSVVSLESSLVEKILNFLTNGEVRMFVLKPELFRVLLSSQKSTNGYRFLHSGIWSLVFSQNGETTASMLSQEPVTANGVFQEELAMKTDLLEELLLYHPVLFENVATGLRETCKDKDCAHSSCTFGLLRDVRASSNCALSHTLCASRRIHSLLQPQIIRVLHLLLQYIGVKQKALPSSKNATVHGGDTVLHVLARNTLSSLAMFRAVLHNVAFRVEDLLEKNDAEDTFLHVLLESEHPQTHDIILAVGVKTKSNPNFSLGVTSGGSRKMTYLEQACGRTHTRAVFNTLVRMTSNEDLRHVFPDGKPIVARMLRAGCQSKAKIDFVLARLKTVLSADECVFLGR
jgi:hypothetical protein